MTISSTVRIAGPFTGNGVTTTFPFAYKVFDAADVQVIRLTISTGIETTLTIVTDYTITLNGDQDSNPGGNIVLVAPLSALYKLTATSDIANLQPTDLTNQGGFYPEVITDALDRATIQIQQVADMHDRTLMIPISDGVLNMEIPNAVNRASKYLVFDASGLPITSAGSGTDTALRTDLAVSTVAAAGAGLVGYRNSAATSTARTVLSKLRDTVSAKDFGATGDGVTDDTAAIQAALDTNKEVFLPNGTYIITSPLAIATGNQLRGESNVFTILKSTSAANSINISDTFNVAISNIHINGNNIGLAGITIGTGAATGAHHRIDRCRITNFTSHGIYALGASYCAVTNTTIQSCATGVHGDTTGAGQTAFNTIENCLIINNTDYNINLESKCHYWTVLNCNTYYDNAGTRTASIRINNSHHVQVNNCSVEVIAGTCTYGILIDDTNGSTTPNTTVNQVTNTSFVGISTYMTYSVGIGVTGAVYNSEISNCTALAAATDLYIGTYGYLTVVSRCLRATSGYDNPITENPFIINNSASNTLSVIPYNQPNSTFTPIVQSTTGTNHASSYSTQLGISQVIGDLVFFSIALTCGAVSAVGGGSLVVTGFPMPIAASGNIYATATVGRCTNLSTPATYNVNIRASVFMQVVQSVNMTAILITYGTSDTAVPANQFINGSTLWINGFYRK